MLLDDADIPVIMASELNCSEPQECLGPLDGSWTLIKGFWTWDVNRVGQDDLICLGPDDPLGFLDHGGEGSCWKAPASPRQALMGNPNMNPLRR